MPYEIERKFLVKDDSYKKEVENSFRISQGYICSHPDRTVRIRIKDEKGYITIKGKSNESGLTRYEWEKEIPLNEAEELLQLCQPTIIDKIRHIVPVDKHIYEVDEFLGENQGLVVAEIELSSENENFTKPEWLSEEVTGDKKYYNSHLIKVPFCNFSPQGE